MQLTGWLQLHRGSNSWEKPTASGGKMEQMTLLPIGKPKAVDNMSPCSGVDIFRVVSAYAEP